MGQLFFRLPGAYGLADLEPVAFFICPGGTLPLLPAVPTV